MNFIVGKLCSYTAQYNCTGLQTCNEGKTIILQPKQRRGLLLRAGQGGGDGPVHPRPCYCQPRGLGQRGGRHAIQR